MKILKTYENFIAEKNIKSLHTNQSRDDDDKNEELKKENEEESDEKQNI